MYGAIVSPVSLPSSHPQNASTPCTHFPFIGHFNSSVFFFWHCEHCHCEQSLLEMSLGFHHPKLQTLSYSGFREFCAALALAFTTPKPRLLSNADLPPTDTPFPTLPSTPWHWWTNEQGHSSPVCSFCFFKCLQQETGPFYG